MNVAWGLCWGGSLGHETLRFLCQVAAAGDERDLTCAVVAGTFVFFFGFH